MRNISTGFGYVSGMVYPCPRVGFRRFFQRFRVFHDCLHTTPVEYIKAYRLQAACRMLVRGQEPVTVISHACGLGSSSYFGKVFREYAHCTPGITPKALTIFPTALPAVSFRIQIHSRLAIMQGAMCRGTGTRP